MSGKTKQRGGAAGGALLAVGMLASGCSLFDGDDASASGSPTSAASAEVGAATEGPCPDHVVLQTDWFPQAEHGGLYQLIGPGGVADKDLFRYSGPLQARYRGAHGVDEVEIRAGGFAVGGRPPAEVLQADPGIYLGYISTDDIIAAALRGEQFTAVVGTLDLNPQMLMWSPARHDISSFEDLRKTKAPVLYFPGSTYMDYLVAEGYVSPDQLDDSYDGNPERWLQSEGDVIQQGFATNEPYYYEHELAAWAKPVEFFLVHWLGYETYPGMLSMTSDRVAEESACLELLVPVLQRAWVDFFADPEPAIAAIDATNVTFDTFWDVSPALSRAAVDTMRQYNIASNGSDDVYGNFDRDRVQRMIGIVTDVLAQRGQASTLEVTVDDIVEDKFIDETVSLPDLGSGAASPFLPTGGG
ncbi:MAG: ABC transporter substrate-binding protein [Acidimicrobiia bacterium]|nr:ABC transporter substrate-binding protein [Acidimicrobiia bacterium]